MTSTTGTQSDVAGLFGAPDWSFLTRIRVAVGRAAAITGRSLASARAYDGALGASQRRAVLREFVAGR